MCFRKVGDSMDEGKKKAFDYINDFQKKTYDRITILRKKGDKDRLKAIAAARNQTTTEFINQAIDEKIKRLGLDISDSKTE